MADNGKSHIIVTRDEFESGMAEQVANIVNVMDVVNTLKRALNAQAEALGLNRFVIEKFVPAPLLEQAVKDFKKQREAAIEAEKAQANGPSHQA